MWKNHLVVLSNLIASYQEFWEGDTFEGRIWFNSICMHHELERGDSKYGFSDNTSIQKKQTTITSDRVMESLTLDGVIHNLVKCCKGQLFTQRITPFVAIHHFSLSTADQKSSLEILTLLLYDALQCNSTKVGEILKHVFTQCDVDIQRQCLLAFNELRDLVMEDHQKGRGIFAEPSLQSSQSSVSSEVLWSVSHPTSYKSPFDIVLDRLHISLELLIEAASTLQLPLTSLLWIHSCSIPQISSTYISSWNTILNYPSLAVTSSEGSFEEKRRRYSDLESSSYTYNSTLKQKLNEHVVNDYLAVNNPHAAMAITQSGQVDQQLLIQCLTNHQGFINTFQT